MMLKEIQSEKYKKAGGIDGIMGEKAEQRNHISGCRECEQYYEKVVMYQMIRHTHFMVLLDKGKRIDDCCKNYIVLQ